MVTALIVVAALAFVMVKRFQPRPVRGDRQQRLPLILCAIGVYDVVNLTRGAHAITLSTTDLSYLVISGALSAALGAVRGSTIRLFEQNGQLMQRYTVATVGAWLAVIAVRLVTDLIAPSLGVTRSLTSGSILMMFGLSLLCEALVVAARTGLRPQFSRR